MKYTTKLERARLALGTAKVFGAPSLGNPASSQEAHALGEALIQRWLRKSEQPG